MLPDRPGTYALILRLDEGATIAVGCLGSFTFSSGWYIYLGSARGPGGLAARVARHRRRSKKLHWHVDYLRAHARPAAVWYTLGKEKRECSWAQALAGFDGASMPASGFGASDCHCPAHLIHFAEPPTLAAFIRAVDTPMLEERLDD